MWNTTSHLQLISLQDWNRLFSILFYFIYSESFVFSGKRPLTVIDRFTSFRFVPDRFNRSSPWPSLWPFFMVCIQWIIIRLRQRSRSRSRWLSVLVLVTVMDGWNGPERSGTDRNDLKRNKVEQLVTGRSRFPPKTKVSLYVLLFNNAVERTKSTTTLA